MRTELFKFLTIFLIVIYLFFSTNGQDCRGFTQAASGHYHSLFLHCSGKIYAVGSNEYGELGDRSTTKRVVLQQVAQDNHLLGVNITRIFASPMYGVSAALGGDGYLYFWGQNDEGTLGVGDRIIKMEPTPVRRDGVLNGKRIVDVSIHSHTLAIDSAGVSYCWGSNSNGELGIGTISSGVTVPMVVQTSGYLNGKKIVAVSAGISSSMFLDENGGVYSAGRILATNQNNLSPTLVPTNALDSQAVKILSGSLFSILLTAGGKLFGCGYNSFGKLGLGDGIAGASNFTAVLIPSNVTISKFSVGMNYVQSLSTQNNDGYRELYAFGDNSMQQIGSVVSDQQTIPFLVNFKKKHNFTQISAGAFVTLALDANGTVYGWGDGTHGQFGAISDDSYFSEAIPVACGEPGYTGENCTAPICFGVAPRDTTICSGHGNCTAPNVCFCPEGYIGEQCEISRCFGKWTNESTACNGGNCTAKDQCVCKNGYSGPECQLFNCFGISHSDSTACSAVGTCEGPDKCSCVAGYSGTECQYFSCLGLTLTKSICSALETSVVIVAAPLSIGLSVTILLCLCCLIIVISCFVLPMVILSMVLLWTFCGACGLLLCGGGSICGSSSLFCCGGTIFQIAEWSSTCSACLFCTTVSDIKKNKLKKRMVEKLSSEIISMKNEMALNSNTNEVFESRQSLLKAHNSADEIKTKQQFDVKLERLRDEIDDICKENELILEKVKESEEKAKLLEIGDIEKEKPHFQSIEDQIETTLHILQKNGLAAKMFKTKYFPYFTQKLKEFGANEQNIQENYLILTEKGADEEKRALQDARDKILSEANQEIQTMQKRIDFGSKIFQKYTNYVPEIMENNSSASESAPLSKLSKFLAEFSDFKAKFQGIAAEFERIFFTKTYTDQIFSNMQRLLDENIQNSANFLEIAQNSSASGAQVQLQPNLNEERKKFTQTKKMLKTQISNAFEEISSITQNIFLDYRYESQKLLEKHKFVLKSAKASKENPKTTLFLESLFRDLRDKFKALIIRDDEVERIESIGKGTFSNVYKGLYQGHVVALKQYAFLTHSDQNLMEKLKISITKELRVLSKIEHENIDGFYGIWLKENEKEEENERESKCFLVLEYLPYNLHDFIKEFHSLIPLMLKLEIMRQIASAIDYCHENGVQHRDVKPENVLIDAAFAKTDDGKDEIVIQRIKICDFSISKFKNPQNSSSTSTTSNTEIMGKSFSQRYASPEQINGLPITEKTDIYSLASTFYFIFTGKVPYFDLQDNQISIKENDVSSVISSKVSEGIIPDLPSEMENTSKILFDFKKILLECWNKDPHDRPNSSRLLRKLETLKNRSIQDLKQEIQRKAFKEKLKSEIQSEVHVKIEVFKEKFANLRERVGTNLHFLKDYYGVLESGLQDSRKVLPSTEENFTNYQGIKIENLKNLFSSNSDTDFKSREKFNNELDNLISILSPILKNYIYMNNMEFLEDFRVISEHSERNGQKTSNFCDILQHRIFGFLISSAILVAKGKSKAVLSKNSNHSISTDVLTAISKRLSVVSFSEMQKFGGPFFNLFISSSSILEVYSELAFKFIEALIKFMNDRFFKNQNFEISQLLQNSAPDSAKNKEISEISEALPSLISIYLVSELISRKLTLSFFNTNLKMKKNWDLDLVLDFTFCIVMKSFKNLNQIFGVLNLNQQSKGINPARTQALKHLDDLKRMVVELTETEVISQGKDFNLGKYLHKLSSKTGSFKNETNTTSSGSAKSQDLVSYKLDTSASFISTFFSQLQI